MARWFVSPNVVTLILRINKKYEYHKFNITTISAVYKSDYNNKQDAG